MRKKILSFVLSTIIVAGFVTQPVQAAGLFPYDSLIFGEDFGQTQNPSGDEDEVIDPNAERFAHEMELKTVVGLKWMGRLEEGKYNPKDLVTKYDIYDALISMTKGPDTPKSINVSADNATFEDLADIFINNLSLNPYVPEGSTFFAAGSMVGLFKGIKGISKDAYVTREQLAKVMYNSLRINQYEAQLGKTPVSYEEGSTVAENLGLEIMEGVVTGNEYINFYSNTPLDEGKVAINKFVVKDETEYAASLLGRKVTAYITDLQEEPTLIFAYVEENNTKSDIQISTDEYITSNSTSLVYDGGNKNKTIYLNPNARVLVNGRYAGQLIGVDVSAYTNLPGTIQTVDTSDDDRADVILITVYNTWVVESIYAVEDDFIISNALVQGAPLKYDENATYYFVKNGEIIDATGIAKGDVLYISESAGTSNKLFMVYVSDQKLEGDITASGNGKITVDGTQLQLIKNFAETIDFKSAILYIGYDGKVAHIEYKKEGDMQYGYIMSLTCNTEEVDEGVMNIRVFTMDGKDTKYTSAEKIWFQDGEAVTTTVADVTVEVPSQKKTPKYVYDKLVAYGTYQLIQFGLDEAGNVSKIATAVNSSATGRIYENVFSKDLEILDGENVRVYSKYLGPRFKRSSTKLSYMEVPTSPDRRTNPKYYSIKTLASSTRLYGKADFYDASANGDIVGGIIVSYAASESAPVLANGCGVGMVTEVGLVYDEVEGVVNYQVGIFSKAGTEVKGIVSQDNISAVNVVSYDDSSTYWELLGTGDVTIPQLEKGDIILYNVDDFGNITAFALALKASDAPDEDDYFEFRYDNATVSQTSTLSNVYAAYTQVRGTETKANGDVIFSANTGLNTVTLDGVVHIDPLWNRSYNVPKSRKVLIYNTESGEITVGSGADIVKGDNIFIETSNDSGSQAYMVIR